MDRTFYARTELGVLVSTLPFLVVRQAWQQPAQEKALWNWWRREDGEAASAGEGWNISAWPSQVIEGVKLQKQGYRHPPCSVLDIYDMSLGWVLRQCQEIRKRKLRDERSWGGPDVDGAVSCANTEGFERPGRIAV